MMKKLISDLYAAHRVSTAPSLSDAPALDIYQRHADALADVLAPVLADASVNVALAHVLKSAIQQSIDFAVFATINAYTRTR